MSRIIAFPIVTLILLGAALVLGTMLAVYGVVSWAWEVMSKEERMK